MFPTSIKRNPLAAGRVVILAIPFALYFTLSCLFSLKNPLIGRDDYWFGADTHRHLRWVFSLTMLSRAQLHPGAILVYKIYGLPLRLLQIRYPDYSDGLTRAALPLGALPVIGFVSYAIWNSAQFFVRSSVASQPEAEGERSGFNAPILVFSLLSALTIGSTLLLAPVPESHSLGGAALLLQGVSVLAAIYSRQINGDDSPTVQRWISRAYGWGIAAAAFTVTNLVLAGLMMVPIWTTHSLSMLHRRRLAQALGAFIALEVAVLGLMSVRHSINDTTRPDFESHWISAPTPRSLQESFQMLVLHQFGLPRVHTEMRLQELAKLPNTEVCPDTDVPPKQALAALLWFGAIFAWMRRKQTPRREKTFILCCLAAIFVQVLFQSFYNTADCFLFSPHVWPFLILPGLLVFHGACRAKERALTACLVACIGLCIWQTAAAFPTIHAALSQLKAPMALTEPILSRPKGL